MDILFWSGGKDAFLAHEFYRRQYPHRPLTLLTTYTKSTAKVPHQNIPVGRIKKQAEALGLGLQLVALPAKCSNDEYLDKLNQGLQKLPERAQHLVFGDWYLQDIRRWREKQFEELGYHCLFPIWKMSINELLPVLFLQPVEVHISAVSKDFEHLISVGETYNQKFVRQLPDDIDPLGEKGEFHTEVIFTSLAAKNATF